MKSGSCSVVVGSSVEREDTRKIQLLNCFRKQKQTCGLEDEESKEKKVTELADVIGSTGCGRAKLSQTFTWTNESVTLPRPRSNGHEVKLNKRSRRDIELVQRLVEIDITRHRAQKVPTLYPRIDSSS